MSREGVSSATFYKYKSKYGGMEPSDAKRLRALEDEHGKLKTLLAEQMLERGLVRHWSEDNERAQCCETSIQKNGDARSLPSRRLHSNLPREESGGASDGCPSDQSAAGV